MLDFFASFPFFLKLFELKIRYIYLCNIFQQIVEKKNPGFIIFPIL